jgi:NAD(P)-dependent dehydrogenase (short-subunit alcohol dehydrogenase family)
MENSYQGKVVIVTGASAGIGRALTILLARQGAKIVLAARRADRLQQLAAECSALGAEVLSVPTDVADESQCKVLIEKTIEHFGQLDVLINNAGLAASAALEDFPNLDLFRHTMDVNLYGTVYCTYYALPYLKKTQGRIAAVSSLGGKSALPFNTPYCTSKYGMHGFFDSLRMEIAKYQISATVICPYWVITEFHEAQMDKNGNPRGIRGRSFYNKRMMTSERCAEIILKTTWKRKREVMMGPGGITLWIKLIAPGLLDWFAIKVLMEGAARRMKKNMGKSL